MAISVLSPSETSQPGPDPQKRTVLVADDDPMSQLVLAGLLQSWGHTCVMVGDGEEALRELQKDDAPTIAFLDWQMPGLEGPDICRHVRAGNSKRYTYIFLVTARDSKQDMLTGLRAGADGYLTKPIDASELKARLDIATRFLSVEESLRELHTTTELYFNAVPSILIGADKEGKISLWNRSAEATFGLSQQDVRGRTLEECGIAWITPGIGAELMRRLATDTASRLDDVLFRKNGKNRCLGLSLQPVRSHGGASEGL